MLKSVPLKISILPRRKSAYTWYGTKHRGERKRHTVGRNMSWFLSCCRDVKRREKHVLSHVGQPVYWPCTGEAGIFFQ